ncbi:MAG: hypothetical protein Q9225_004596 [Loekoesia sp. 1 TL-2023]
MNPSAKSTKKISNNLDETDERLQRLREDTLPYVPYLMDLTTPSRYHLPPHQANNWRRSCPFEKHEEQLQYMTFLPHHVRGDTMLRTIGDWDDGDGRMKTEQAKRTSGGSSGAISPSAGQQPKKKISLLDYKNKMAGQPSGRTSPKVESNEKQATNEPLARSEAIVKPAVKTDAPAKLDEVKQDAAQKPRVEASRGHKRSADAMAQSQDAKTFDIPPNYPPSKKVHMDPAKDQAASAAALKVENGNIHGLPRMLSPTLPASVEEQLAKMRGGDAQPVEKVGANPAASSKVKSTANRNSVSAAPTTKPTAHIDNAAKEAIAKEKRPAQPALAKTSSLTDVRSTTKENKPSNRGTDGASLKTKTTTAEVPKAITNGLKPDGETQLSKASNSKDVQEGKSSRIVVFKIPKALRKNCQRILHMQPRPRKLPGQSQSTPSFATQDRSQERPSSNGSTSHHVPPKKIDDGDNSRRKGEADSKPKAVAAGSRTPKSSEKRRQADDDKDSNQPSSKRQKFSGADLHKPLTPVGSALKSPNLPQPSSTQKSQLSTPKHDLKSAAMRRFGSTEGDVKTPLGSMRGNTPTAPGSAERSNNRDGRSSSNVSLASTSVSASKNDEGVFYKAEFTKYAEKARSLKRGADALAKLKDGQVNDDSVARRQGLAIAIETTLCYMLAFTLKDESDRIKRLPGDRAAWVSLLPYFKFLKSLIRDDDSPHLQGFLYHLEAVCRETVLHHDLERLERDPMAIDEESTTFRKSMAENGKLVIQAWASGTSLLTVDDFQREFPKTWDKRLRAPKSSREKEKLLPKRYGEGDFYLPLSSTSSGIEAVRAGWSFLGEWCKKEGVKWEGKMGL